MFEGDLTGLDTRALLSVGAEFRLAEDHAAVRQLEVALAFADRYPDPRADADYGTGYDEPLPGGERGRVYGGVGCPAVAEFAAAELGAVFGWSTGTAEAFIGEALALRHRLPRIWAMVLAGKAVPWRARQVARACLALSQDAAAIVDKRVAGIINSVGLARLKAIVKAAILEADPDAAKAAAEQAARERGVFVGESDDHGTKTIWVKAAAGDVIRFDATIDDLARALRTLGDTDSLDLRRAKAIGWIADPASAHRLLEAARLLATTRAQTPDDAGTAGASTNSAGTASTDQAGGAGDRDRGRGDTGAGAAAAGTDPAAQCPPQSCPADADDTASDSEDGQERAGDRAERAEDVAAGSPADLAADWMPAAEPGLDGEADRDTPHPSGNDHLDYLDSLDTADLQAAMAILAWRHGPRPAPQDAGAPPGPDTDPGTDPGVGAGADAPDAFSRQALAGKLAAIRQAAYSHGLGATTGGGGGVGRGPGRNTLYLHLTDKTLAAGEGVVRVEGAGPFLVGQLAELVGYDQIVVKPVIDLNDRVSVDAYEIPDVIRERVKLMDPVDQFPWGTAETTFGTDLDHVEPYDTTGPPGQTSTENLAPASRFHHRLKTHSRWKVRRLPGRTLEWTSPHGFKWRRDPTGTHRIDDIDESGDDAG